LNNKFATLSITCKYIATSTIIKLFTYFTFANILLNTYKWLTNIFAKLTFAYTLKNTFAWLTNVPHYYFADKTHIAKDFLASLRKTFCKTFTRT